MSCHYNINNIRQQHSLNGLTHGITDHLVQ